MLNAAALVTGLAGALVLMAGFPVTPSRQIALALAVVAVAWLVWRLRAMDREAAILRRLLPHIIGAISSVPGRSGKIGRLAMRMAGRKGDSALVHLRAGNLDRIGRAATALGAAWTGLLVPTREDDDGFEAHVMVEGDERSGIAGVTSTGRNSHPKRRSRANEGRSGKI